MKLTSKTRTAVKPGTVLKSYYKYTVESVTECGNAIYITLIAEDRRRIYFNPISKWYGAEICEQKNTNTEE